MPPNTYGYSPAGTHELAAAPAPAFSAMRVARLCVACAKQFAMPTHAPGYILDVAAQLLGTAAQESLLRWERQQCASIPFDQARGGFSKWQVEPLSVSESVQMLQANASLRAKACAWLYADQHGTDTWLSFPTQSILWAMSLDDNDKIGALFARLHYMRKPGLIPHDVDGQAAYWKRYYNTSLGSGTEAQYKEHWYGVCDPIWHYVVAEFGLS